MVWIIVFFVVILCIDYTALRNAEIAISKAIENVPYEMNSDMSNVNSDKFQTNEDKKDSLFGFDDDDDFDDFIDKEEFNFLLLGVIATLLFLFFGFFTGNTIYFYLMIFVISAVVYINGRNK